MGKVKIVLNREGVRDLLRSDEMQSILREHANAALSQLGDGYEVTEHVGRNRANAQIAATEPKAYFENLKNNTILKAVRGS